MVFLRQNATAQVIPLLPWLMLAKEVDGLEPNIVLAGHKSGRCKKREGRKKRVVQGKD